MNRGDGRSILECNPIDEHISFKRTTFVPSFQDSLGVSESAGVNYCS